MPTKIRGRLKRLGGHLSKRFGVYHRTELFGEVRHDGTAWIAYVVDLGGELHRLPGSYDTKEDARNVIVDANRPDDRLPAEVSVALDALGMEDHLPVVDEPEAPAEVKDGEYAVLHKNDYAVCRPPDDWGVVSRHESEDDARKACEAKWRGFEAATTQGCHGPEWCVGVLADGEWKPVASDDDQ